MNPKYQAPLAARKQGKADGKGKGGKDYGGKGKSKPQDQGKGGGKKGDPEYKEPKNNAKIQSILINRV